MKMIPFTLLEGDGSFCITHPFSGFRFCVINQVSAPKLLSLISVTCQMDIIKAHTVPYNEICHHLWDSLAPSVHTLLCNPVGPGQFCALTQWMSSSLATSAAEHVCMPHIICSRHAWCPGHYLSTSVLPLLKAMHHICLLSWYYTYSTHRPQLAVDFYWCNTHHTQKSKHTSYFKVCHGSGKLSFFNLTYLCFPLIAVQWHNPHVLITCLNLQSHDIISCQTCGLPYFLKPPCVPVRGRKLKIWYNKHTYNKEYNWDE